jgi:hypothetical protein
MGGWRVEMLGVDEDRRGGAGGSLVRSGNHRQQQRITSGRSKDFRECAIC